MEFDFTSLLIPGMFGCQCAFFIGVLALVFGIAYATRQARTRAWTEVAERTGLTLEPGSFFKSPRLSGTYRAHTLALDTFSRSHGKSSTTYTRIVVFVNNRANVYLALYEEGVFSKIGKFFGSEDIQVGDEEIDRRFIIKSRPPEVAPRLLTSISLRSKLLEARSINVEMDGRELYFEQRGAETNLDYLVFLFDLLTDLAEFVERV